MPSFHNPTGITTDQAHRERLLALCEAHRVPVVEDGFEEEMKYFGQAVLPIKSMDAHGIVLYVGTFSKVVFPGLRVGWLVAPPAAIERLTAVHHASALAGNTLAQAAAARFCTGGRFEAHLRRIHRVYRQRMQAMVAGLAENLPPGVAWTRPAGGYTLWLTLPAGADEDAVRARLETEGVLVGAGRRHFGRRPARGHLRLSIACVAEADIADGCRRLGSALATAV
jgi:DNA-binding transcriptional MocR family regulator